MIFWEFIAKLYGKIFLGHVFTIQTANGEIWVVKRLFPRWAVGQTWGRVIFILYGLHREKGLVTHEQIHVYQWRELGFWFPFAYFWEMLKCAINHGVKNAYKYNKFEVEARKKSGFPS